MLVNGQLKNAQLEIVSNKTAGTKGGISYNPECESIEIDKGDKCERVMDSSDLPVGSLMMWPCESPPNDRYVFANGAELVRAEYIDLFSAIGVKYGAGDGTTTFNIPDYRGMFLRGTDYGRGCDPEAADRTDRGDGTLGDQVGTQQDDEVGSHTHVYLDRYRFGAGNKGDQDDNWDRVPQDITRTTNPSTGLETRPKNININFMIKVK